MILLLEGAGNRTSLAGEFLDLMEKMVRGEDDGETIVAEELRVSMAVHSSQRRDMRVFASIFLLCLGSTSTHFNINSVEVSQRLLADYMTAH